MSLIKCNECGKEISDKSKECVNCGAPIKIKKKKDNWISKHKKLLFIVAIAIVLLVVIKTFIFSPIMVNGNSMYPTLKDGEMKILNKLDRSFNRYDVVIVKHDGSLIPRRIYGLPGETVEFMSDGSVLVDGKELDSNYFYEDKEKSKNVTFVYTKSVLNRDEYFVLGDNIYDSFDSATKRSNNINLSMGIVNKQDIKGTILGD